MNLYRSFAIVAMLIGTLAATAQQPSTTPSATENRHNQGNTQTGLPSVEQQLKAMTAKLDLTSDQQAKITPILQQLHDVTIKLMQDSSLSNEERLNRIRPERYKTRDEIRAVLNEDQKQKLDEYLQGPHSEMHGSITGTTPRPQPNN